MSGYGGNPDLESEHAQILSENGVEASRSMLRGRVLLHCLDCGKAIPEPRRQFAIEKQMKCEYCVECQSFHDKAPRVKMLDHVL